MKEIEFLGSSLRDLQSFPKDVRRKAGFELQQVQRGFEPSDFKPMASVGAGVQELRIWDLTGTFRVIYLARLEDAVYVLHAFQKKTQATAQRELEIARRRLKAQLQKMRRMP
ncbi:MAG TPA: type II toxin-antitoxin system RelE/ParE family toxin [Acidobacteriaceae bacterium]|nr:type II toxin-antitoxin system RelE/ParE family toxin [Acidobacteriaceae bacterium]